MGRLATPDREQRDSFIRANWQALSVAKIANRLQTSAGAIYRDARRLRLPIKPRGKARTKPVGKDERRTKFPHRIVTAQNSPALLVEGAMNRKIGKRVTKGPWKGLPIYTLTLAERITCPKSCAVWSICYGDNLNWSRRHMLDRDLIDRLGWELTALNAKHPDGFVVRPHVLGDFGSDEDVELALAYVSVWRSWMMRFDGLHVWGYTAWPPGSLVGVRLAAMNKLFPNRFRFRFSGQDSGHDGAVVVKSATDAPTGVVVCPYETPDAAGQPRVDSCGACGLCWSMGKTVAFVEHL